MKSKHLCPDCKTPLTVEECDGDVLLYCAYGPCASYIANDGATAATEDEAWKKLEKAVEDDINERMDE